MFTFKFSLDNVEEIYIIKRMQSNCLIEELGAGLQFESGKALVWDWAEKERKAVTSSLVVNFFPHSRQRYKTKWATRPDYCQKVYHIFVRQRKLTFIWKLRVQNLALASPEASPLTTKRSVKDVSLFKYFKMTAFLKRICPNILYLDLVSMNLIGKFH